MSKQELVDPDPWVVVSIILSTVATVAQVAQLGLQIGLGKTRSRPLFNVKGGLSEATHQCIRDVEKIVKIGRSAFPDALAFSTPFRFGEASLFFNPTDLQTYSGSVSRLLVSLEHLSTLTLTLLADDPEFAGAYGAEILHSFGDIKSRINAFYRDAPPMADVIDECLTMLREFERILVRLEDTNG